MKLHLIIYIAIAAVLSACENEIPYHPDNQQPMLIMNAQLDAGKEVNEVFLHMGQGYNIERVNEATLTLYVNDRVAETPRALTPEEIIGPQDDYYSEEYLSALYKSIRYKLFRLNTPLHPGDRIRLEATAEEGKYHVSAEVVVPQPIESLHVDTCLTYLRQYGGQTLYRQYEVTLQDHPNEKNYYRLDIWNDRSYRCTRQNGKDTILVAPRETEIINREDAILTDGHPSSYDDEENEMFPTISNKYNIFTDHTFRDSHATLKVYTPLYWEFSMPSDFYLYDRIYSKQTITVRLLSITEGEYRYLRALNNLEDDDYDETLMEPITLPCNVTNGLGFVSICSESKIVMEFPEEQIQ